MDRKATMVALVLSAQLTLTGCGGDPDVRTELIVEVCGYEKGDIPPQDEWIVDDEFEPPLITVTLDDGRIADLNFKDGATVDDMEKNRRIGWVSCYPDETSKPSTFRDVSWSPDGRSYTLAKDPDATASSKTDGTDAEEVTLEREPGLTPVRDILGALSGGDIEVAFKAQERLDTTRWDLDSFDCGDDTALYSPQDTATCSLSGGMETALLVVTVTEDEVGKLGLDVDMVAD